MSLDIVGRKLEKFKKYLNFFRKYKRFPGIEEEEMWIELENVKKAILN